MNFDCHSIDPGNALACLKVCADAYMGDPTIATDLAHVAIDELPDAIIVAYRGSKSAEDWLTDFKCAMVHVGDGWIHNGFYKSHRTSFEKVIEYLLKLPRRPLFITGHSLGGAQAILCAEAIARLQSPLEIAQVYTFGQPRVGDRGYCGSYDSALGGKTFRFVNEEDIVPRVPFSIMGFCHAGQEAYLPAKGGVVMNPSKWSLITEDVLGTWRGFKAGELTQLPDHHLPRYDEKLQRL